MTASGARRLCDEESFVGSATLGCIRMYKDAIGGSQNGNPGVSLKLLAAHYRRINQLVDFVKAGKASLPEGDGSTNREFPQQDTRP